MQNPQNQPKTGQYQNPDIKIPNKPGQNEQERKSSESPSQNDEKPGKQL